MKEGKAGNVMESLAYRDMRDEQIRRLVERNAFLESEARKRSGVWLGHLCMVLAFLLFVSLLVICILWECIFPEPHYEADAATEVGSVPKTPPMCMVESMQGPDVVTTFIWPVPDPHPGSP